MIGLVLVTHGRLATEFVVAMEHVVGPQERIEPICIGPDDDMEARREDIAQAIARVDDGSGVIILTDLFGGTPSNLAISLMDSEKIEVIAGVNLPMLIRLEGARKTMDVKPLTDVEDDIRMQLRQKEMEKQTKSYLGELRKKTLVDVRY